MGLSGLKRQRANSAALRNIYYLVITDIETIRGSLNVNTRTGYSFLPPIKLWQL